MLINTKIINIKIQILMTFRQKIKKMINKFRQIKYLERLLKQIQVKIFLPKDKHLINIKMSPNLNHAQI